MPPSQKKREVGARSFPAESTVNPYDPTTFGFTHLGTMGAPHGLSGDLKIRVSTDFAAERLSAGSDLHLLPPSRRFPRAFRVVQSRPLGEAIDESGEPWLVRFEGIDSRESAVALQRQRVFVWKDHRKQALER